ncbi:hypothetical protein PS843_04268 [Pseudomonas fluorescens]|jgi:hypothetical protein|nr:hypothetical protein PS843_04268 [Pseudomonas fluorescens]
MQDSWNLRQLNASTKHAFEWLPATSDLPTIL